MSIEENKAILRRLMEECWNKRNLSVLNELIAPDCPHHMNGPVNFKGPDGFKGALENWFKSLPDLQVTIDEEVAEGDMVVTRGKLKGTHTGEMQFPRMPAAIPPTGKQVEFEAVSMCRIADGKIIEHWSIADFSWRQQLGQS